MMVISTVLLSSHLTNAHALMYMDYWTFTLDMHGPAQLPGFFFSKDEILINADMLRAYQTIPYELRDQSLLPSKQASH